MASMLPSVISASAASSSRSLLMRKRSSWERTKHGCEGRARGGPGAPARRAERRVVARRLLFRAVSVRGSAADDELHLRVPACGGGEPRILLEGRLDGERGGAQELLEPRHLQFPAFRCRVFDEPPQRAQPRRFRGERVHYAVSFNCSGSESTGPERP